MSRARRETRRGQDRSAPSLRSWSGDADDRAQVTTAVEAATLAGVAGRTDLVDLHEHRVTVAVERHRLHPLLVTAGLALDPVLLPTAAPVGAAAGRQRAVQRLVVHPPDHQHLTGVPLLGHRANEAGVVALEALGDLWVQRG